MKDETKEELEKNNEHRASALAPVVAELVRLNEQMTDLFELVKSCTRDVADP